MENFQVNNMQAFPFKGFWIRVVASLLDAIILSIVFIFLAVFILFFFGSLFGEAAGFGMLFLFILGGSILMLLYKPLMEASDYQATFGKYFLNMKIVDKEGRKIIIIGDHGHDEVIGIASQVPDPVIVASVEEAEALRKTKKAGVVTQSTQTIENVQDIINILMTKVFDLRFVNTICFPTKRNQEQIKELSEVTDLMIIIGSFTSANSKRLAELSSERNENTFQVTCAAEINSSWFKDDVNSVGISAGASTPDWIIESVIKKVKEITNTVEKEIIHE